MLILTRADTESLLEPDGLRRAVARAMADVSAGNASMPARTAAQVAEKGAMLAVMPAYLPGLGGLAAKLVSLFPGNAGTRLPTHQAVVVVFDAGTGEPIALVDGTSITAERTAAGSALSTELLARPEARSLAILGTGVQARAHARAVVRVRPIDEVRIAGRDPRKARLLADQLSAAGVKAVAVDNFGAACDGADVVCATTHSAEPVVHREYLADGVHVTSVGYNVQGREVDSQTMADAMVVVESRAAVLAPAPSGSNDIRIPIEQGVFGADHIHAEIGELVSGTKTGRSDPSQITLYKSVGVAAQDVAAAAMVIDAARSAGIGTEIAF
jgi:ornithine cyclodeaminase